jgi:hypothetical protein
MEGFDTKYFAIGFDLAGNPLLSKQTPREVRPAVYQTFGAETGAVMVTSSPDGSMRKKPCDNAYRLVSPSITIAAMAP